MLNNYGNKTLKDLIDHEKGCSYKKEETSMPLRTQISDISTNVESSMEKQNSYLINIIKANNSKIKKEILINLS